MERLPRNIENCQFLQDRSYGFLQKNKELDGSAEWAYRTAKDKLIV